MTAQEFLDKIAGTFNELKTLRITTAVGQVAVKDGKPEINYRNEKLMFTKLDLLDGDIQVSVDPMYLDPQYAALYQLHADNTKAGREIISANIEALKKLVGLASDLVARAQK